MFFKSKACHEGGGDIVGDLIEDYEAKHHPLREVTGVQALKFLIRVGGLHAGAAHAAGA